MDGPLSTAAGPYPAVVVLLALLLDAYVGDARRFRDLPAHPGVVLDRALDWLGTRLDRPERGAGDRRVRGAAALVLVAGAAVAVGRGVTWLSGATLVGWTLELALLSLLVACRGTADRAAAVVDRLRDDSLEAARTAVAAMADAPTAEMDRHAVARTAVERLAATLDGRLAAPLLYYLLLGLPGALAWWAVTGFRSHAVANVRSAAYVAAAGRVERVAAWLPGRVAAAALVLAALASPGASALRAAAGLRRGRRARNAIAHGWPVAAMAGALDLALAGPQRYPQRVVERPWIGTGRARAEATDLVAALRLYRTAWILAGAAAAAAVARHWLP